MAVGELEVVVATPGTPVPLSATSKVCNHFTVQAGKTGASPGDNTGDIYVGSEVCGNGAGAPQAAFGVRLATGQSYSPPPSGVGKPKKPGRRREKNRSRPSTIIIS